MIKIRYEIIFTTTGDAWEVASIKKVMTHITNLMAYLNNESATKKLHLKARLKERK